MPRPKRPATSPRKAPTQARSTQLVGDLLKAAVRVLEREGADRFTTIRVAEVAGVSVGSLYQYFPNKQAILFRLQVDEWAKTGAAMDAILGDETRTPAARLRIMTRAFFRSECEEAPLRLALDAAAPSYHEAPEAQDERRRSRRVLGAFIAAAAPHATAAERRFAGDLLFTLVTAVGKQVSERRPSSAYVDRYADAVSAMLTTYFHGLGRPPAKRSTPRAGAR